MYANLCACISKSNINHLVNKSVACFLFTYHVPGMAQRLQTMVPRIQKAPEFSWEGNISEALWKQGLSCVTLIVVLRLSREERGQCDPCGLGRASGRRQDLSWALKDQ